MSGAGLGYAITDARSTFSGYLAAGKILAPKSDEVAGKVESDADTDVIALWANQIDDFCDQINEVFTGNRSILGPLKIGDSTFPGVIELNKPTSGSSYIDFFDSGTRRWRLYFLSDESLYLNRYNASGTFQESTVVINQSDGSVQVDERLYVGDAGGSPRLHMRRSATGSAMIWFTQNTSDSPVNQDKRIFWDPSGEILFSSYDGSSSSWVTAWKVTSLGGFRPGDEGSHLFTGTGAPASSLGNSGDIYFRSDGAAGSVIYAKISGTWTAIA